ncbi:MAG: MBOAT family protein [Candidatus Omnitrophota bacterium]
MLFNSIEYLIFFVLVSTIYFVVPDRIKWFYLLITSFYFYMCWIPKFIVLMLIPITIDYFTALKMGGCSEERHKFKYLMISLCSNLGLLFSFKYFNFFSESVSLLLAKLNMPYLIPHLNVLLPVGISFYTFQSLSYTIDVYRGQQKPQKHFGRYAAFVSFFPQLVAGPIERSQHLLPQFNSFKKFDYERVTDGVKLMLWGLFKKAVIADRVAVFVNQVYNNPHDYTGWPLILATVFFAFQIYCDFSGYSDIAIGSAKVLGFNLMDNFNRPYYSKSVQEFWKRWHISLSTWFRDYVYIPLGGSKVSKQRLYLNLMFVFVVSGLWHGASWTFIIWGALNGFYLVFSLWTSRLREKWNASIGLTRYPLIHKYVKVFITFSLINFTWIFFRANSLSDAWYIATHIFQGLMDEKMFVFIINGFGFGYKNLIVSCGAIFFMEYIHSIQRHSGIRAMLKNKPYYLRLSVYTTLILCILLFGEFSAKQFIYFQF